MNIKRFALLSSASLIVFAAVFSLQKVDKESYFPRSQTFFTKNQQLAVGYQDYIASIKSNRETGFISTAEVQAARKQANRIEKRNKSLNLTWRFKGPDNVGGRTRAIIVDRNDTSHILAGGVSGGIWESFDAAVTWQPYDPDFKIQNVSSMAQGSDGSIYVGTGSSFDGNSNNKNKRSDFLGTGLYKLTGNGASTLLAGPASSNTFNTEWSYVNDIEVDPNNSQRVLVAMNQGLRESTDGGTTWNSLLPFPDCQDVEINTNGTIVASFPGGIYTRLSGSTSFIRIPFQASRIEMAFAPSDQNIMYAGMANFSRCLLGVYRSIDEGLTWTKLSNTPNYFNSGGIQCQGTYDNEIIVFPNDPGKIIVGGIGTYVWRQSSVDPAPPEGEWVINSTLSEFFIDGSKDRRYVHADVHLFVFNPENPNTMYLGTDGGVAVSFNIDSDRPLYSTSNLGYNVTQFYDIGVGPNDQVAGGTQDNGTQFIGLPFNTGKSAVQVRGGDGFDTKLFTINPTLGIASLYFGDINRLQGLGTTLEGTIPNNAQIYTGSLLNICGGEGSGRFECSPVFYTSTSIWESFNHSETKDSVIAQIRRSEFPPLKAGTLIPYNSKNNSIPLEGIVDADKMPGDTIIEDIVDIKEFINNNQVSTFITSAHDTIVVDLISKELILNLFGGTSDTSAILFGKKVSYNNIFIDREGGSQLELEIDSTRASIFSIEYEDAPITFYYEIEFPDIVQSMVSLANVQGRVDNTERNVWISKDILKGGDIRWFKVAGTRSSPSAMPRSQDALANEFTKDGNHLFIGTSAGQLYRIDGLNNIDVSQIPITADDEFLIDNNITSVTRIDQGFGNRAVTGIAIDPNNGNNLIVTLGNYGNTSYIRRSTNALSNNPSFDFIDGVGTNELPNTPVYDAVIDRKDPNRVLIATEFGVFATENAFDTATLIDPNTSLRSIDVRWTEENTGVGRSPVYTISQMVFGSTEGAINEGKIYIGTHGRGIYETDQLVGIDDFVQADSKKSLNPSLTIYPNPVRDQSKLDITVVNPSSVRLQIYSISGQMVLEIFPENLTKGLNTINLNLADLDNGTYIIRLADNGKFASGKFIKQ